MDSGNVIGAGVHVKGRITGAGSLTVDGAVDGEITLDGDVVINRSAEVSAPISGANLNILGTLRGPATAARSLTIGPGAVVEGALTAPNITIHPDAKLSGRVRMQLDLPKGITRPRSSGDRW